MVIFGRRSTTTGYWAPRITLDLVVGFTTHLTEVERHPLTLSLVMLATFGNQDTGLIAQTSCLDSV